MTKKKTTVIEVYNENVSIDCPYCDNWEELPINAPRHEIQSFELKKWGKWKKGECEKSKMKCLSCNQEFNLFWDYKEESIENKFNISIYDNMGKSLDRITIIFNKEIEKKNYRKIIYNALSCCEIGVGFFTHTTAQKGRHLGKKISFKELSVELQKKIKTYLYE